MVVPIPAWDCGKRGHIMAGKGVVPTCTVCGHPHPFEPQMTLGPDA